MCICPSGNSTLTHRGYSRKQYSLRNEKKRFYYHSIFSVKHFFQIFIFIDAVSLFIIELKIYKFTAKMTSTANEKTVKMGGKMHYLCFKRTKSVLMAFVFCHFFYIVRKRKRVERKRGGWRGDLKKSGS